MLQETDVDIFRAAGRDIAGYEPDAPKPYAATTRSLRSAPSRYSFARPRSSATRRLFPTVAAQGSG